MASPTFTSNSAFSERGPLTPLQLAPDERTMTLDNTIRKSLILFAIVLMGAGVGWFVPGIALFAGLAAFVVSLIIAFKAQTNVPLIMAFSALQGVFVGGLSSLLEASLPGIVIQAVLATFVVVGTTLMLYLNGKVRTSPKMTKFFLIAIVSYLVFSILNLVLQLTGVIDGAWGIYSATVFGIPLGLLIGVFAVLLGTYSLLMDFDYIKNGVRNRMPEKYEWSAAHGLIVTIIWIYVEILRLIAILRGE